MPLRRQPADPAFIARRLALVSWPAGRAPRLRDWLAEACRTELDWAETEWRRLSGERFHSAWGAHTAETWHLPHERAAARLLNCHYHVDAAVWSIAKLVPTLRVQRLAALDANRGAADRAQWANIAAGSEADLRILLARRRLAWKCFLAAARQYLHLRMTSSDRLPALPIGPWSARFLSAIRSHSAPPHRIQHDQTPVRTRPSGADGAGHRGVQFAGHRS